MFAQLKLSTHTQAADGRSSWNLKLTYHKYSLIFWRLFFLKNNKIVENPNTFCSCAIILKIDLIEFAGKLKQLKLNVTYEDNLNSSSSYCHLLVYESNSWFPPYCDLTYFSSFVQIIFRFCSFAVLPFPKIIGEFSKYLLSLSPQNWKLCSYSFYDKASFKGKLLCSCKHEKYDVLR